MAKKRFTFADAKERIKELETALLDEQKKIADLVLDTEDNVFTKKELKKIRLLEGWLWVSVPLIIFLVIKLVA